MDNKFLRRCGLMGVGILVIIPSLSMLISLSLSPNKYLRDLEAFKSFGSTPLFITWLLGYFTGKKCANTQSVIFAFLKGGVFIGLTGAVFILPIIIRFIYDYGIKQGIIFIYFIVILGVIYICAGSILGGWAAIMARDYRNFQRVRLLPQYTISELFIIITLVAVIFGSIMSISLLLSNNPCL
ncbi:MAG: hypothetical protein ABSE63_08960 [Thermoguttaceae bacterium]|jgi:hypothetical protein